MSSAIRALRHAFEPSLVGQDDAITGLILALVARQHAFLEGPPGSGKTLLAEELGRVAGARTAALRCHRDTGIADLLGDPVLLREPTADGEILRRGLVPGELLKAELAVLDDLDRAPGEALTPLLRVLSERQALGRDLPLECAIATASLRGEQFYADPIEPAQLDRFAIQVRLRGLICAQRWPQVRALLDEPERPHRFGIDTKMRHALQRRAFAVRVDPETRAGLMRAIYALISACGEEPNTLLSDRAFGGSAIAVMRAHAVMRDSDVAQPQDLRALRYMLACRVPESVLARADSILDEVIADSSAQDAPPAGQPGNVAADAAGSGVRAPESAQGSSVEAPQSRAIPNQQAPIGADAAEVEDLVRALAGRLERGAVESDEDPGGQPRGYRRMRRLDEILDADPIDATLLVEGRLPAGARVYRRERQNAGGALAVLRDVSASMEGRLSRWAGQVVAGIVRTAARKRIRVGYVEFNHQAERFSTGGSFFHRSYGKLMQLARGRRAEGRTNYQAPLHAALTDFQRVPGRNRHIVMLTDGVPILGDPEVRRERALARELGVRVHTVFLGLGDCPRVLDDISTETGGLRFLARPLPGGGLRVQERAEFVCETN